MVSQVQLMAAPSRRDHVPVGLEMDVALPFGCAPPISQNRWDKELLAMLALQGRGRSQFLEAKQKELEGMVKGGVNSQPHLSAEEYWKDLSNAICRAGQSFICVPRKRMERPSDTAVALQEMLAARQAVVDAPVDPLSFQRLRLSGFSSAHLGVLGVALIISLVGIVNIKSIYASRHFRLRGTSVIFRRCGHLHFVYRDAHLVPKNECIINWLRRIQGPRNGNTILSKQVIMVDAVLQWLIGFLQMFLRS